MTAEMRSSAPRRRMVARLAIGFVVAMTTVVSPVGGPGPAAAAPTDLPDRTWGVEDLTRSITTLVPSEVMAIEQVGNTIYVGGQFATVVRRRAVDPEQSQAYLAAFDATTGDWLDWWRPQLNGPVYSLAASADGKRLYVGGEFTEVNGYPGTTGLVALVAASGRVDHTWTPRIENAFVDDPGVVRSLEESGGWLYVAGNFTHVTGNNKASRRYVWKVARLSLTTAAPDPSWRPVVTGGAVWGLDHDPERGRVYLAGYFESVNSATPSDRFAVVTDTDGSTITNLVRFPELTPNQDHQFEVIAHGDYVWVAGTQHLVHMLNAADLSIHRRWFTGFGVGSHVGGDFQAIGIVGDAMYATCHCWGVVRELPNWVTTLTEARNIAPITDEVQGIMGFDLATGDYIPGWTPDILGSIGGWAVHGAADGCLWAGGDFNRRSLGDAWRNSVVRWCDDGGPGPPAGPPLIEQPPPEANPPTAPPSLTAVDGGKGTVDLAWGASRDDTAVAYYRVYRNGWMMRATRDLALTDLAATPGYWYTVRAVDPYGTESADSPRATPALAGYAVPVLNASFDGNDGGFVFTDDAFSGTDLPGYADGLVRRDGGAPDGNLMIILGGMDALDLGPFSGAWQRGFLVPTAGEFEIALKYRLDVRNALESTEYGQARVAIDETQLGGGYLRQIAGGGDTGWVDYRTTVTLDAGVHVISLGGYQNSKSNNREFVEISYDQVSITPLRPAVGFISPIPGSKIAGITEFELRATSPGTPAEALTIEVSADGGTAWAPAAWNPAKQRFVVAYDSTASAEGPLAVAARVTDTEGRTGTGSATYVVDNNDDPVLDDGAESYWRLGETGGTRAIDIAGGRHGTYRGKPTLGTEPLVADAGSAVDFDGVNDLVLLPNSAALNVGGPYATKTVELWFNADDVRKRQVLWEQGGAARGLNIYLFRGRLYAGAWNTADDPDPSTPWAAPVFVSTPVAANTTYHVVLVFKQPAGRLRLFVNGTRVAKAPGVGLLYAHDGRAAIGAMRGRTLFHNKKDGGGNKHFFNGVIDNVAFYNRALSGATIRNHYALGRRR